MSGEKDTKQVLVIRKDLRMRRGKEISQGSHGSGAFVFRQLQEQVLANRKAGIKTKVFAVTLSEAEQDWIAESYAKITCQANSEEQLLALEAKAQESGVVVHRIEDSGRTEFGGVSTNTCIAIGPDYVDVIEPVTGTLALY